MLIDPNSVNDIAIAFLSVVTSATIGEHLASREPFVHIISIKIFFGQFSGRKNILDIFRTTFLVGIGL